MTHPKRMPSRLVQLLLAGLLLIGGVDSAAQEKSPSHLIRMLDSTLDRPAIEAESAGLFSCGQHSASRAVAMSLARLGDSAVPALERELAASERLASEFRDRSVWLQLAYARIRGRAAYPRLRRMEGDPSPGSDRRNLDSPIALALNLTSYVSDSRPLARIIRCNRGPEPRDPLDQLILAWQKSNLPWLESSLGPIGKSALNWLMAGKTWESLRAEIWRDMPVDGVAIGYRFETPGDWSEPGETLEEGGSSGSSASVNFESPFDLETQFTNRSGAECGRKRIRFLRIADGQSPGRYLVDDSDLVELLRLIASCAAQAGPMPRPPVELKPGAAAP